ncbi:hypothetical protein Cgig2_015768 [Carnegiea gigantea]|uniref:Uncharacterized protein n=1 Tax=Carnegiea gigantea TaxID=171969 RepID=A0A9Q1KHZ5_9CARY|nr:hypothetical protein Cgig2_015768 [Carnegiea gigantea]
MEVTYESKGNLDDETDRSDFAYANEEGAMGRAVRQGFLVTGKPILLKHSEDTGKMEQLLKEATADYISWDRGRCVRGLVWDLISIVEDVKGMAEFNWSKVAWMFLVKAMEETLEKMNTVRNLQINGFVMILQVWFCEHTSIYSIVNDNCVPRISSWGHLYEGKKYDARIMVADIKGELGGYIVTNVLGNGVISIDVARHTAWKEKEAYAATKKELAKLKASLVGKEWGGCTRGRSYGVLNDVEDVVRESRLLKLESTERIHEYGPIHNVDPMSKFLNLQTKALDDGMVVGS